MVKKDESDNNSNVYPYPFPCCVWDEVCKVNKNIEEYTRKMRAAEKKFKRTCSLAIPRYQRPKFRPQPIQKFRRVIQRVHQPTISSRLEQLAFVPLRKLLAVRKQFRHLLDKTHQRALNRLMRNSTFSLYARLANVVPPRPQEKIYKWTEKDWQYMNKRLKKLATPKKLIKPIKIVRKKRPLEAFIRTEELALPRQRDVPGPNVWVYKESMRKQETSDRTRELAVPKTRQDRHYKDPKMISRGALRYKITERTTQLSQPQGKRTKDSDLKDNPFEVSKNAMKYRATARITDLAEPKDYPKVLMADDKISPAALKYKASPRILELAEPRKPAETS